MKKLTKYLQKQPIYSIMYNEVNLSFKFIEYMSFMKGGT